jgi:hypothetical protein
MVLRFGLGLVGDKCEDESAEVGDAKHGDEQDVPGCEGCFECGFGFVVHGFWGLRFKGCALASRTPRLN